MKRSIENLTFAVFAFGLALLLLVGFASYTANSALVHETLWVTHTQDVLRDVESIEGALASSESAMRGFIIRADNRFLGRFDAATAELVESVAAVEKLTEDNPSQHARATKLHELVVRRIEMMRYGIGVRQQHGLQETLDATSNMKYFEATQEIRERLHEFQAEEQRLLSTRQRLADTINFWMRVVIFVGTGLGFVMVAAATMIIRRAQKRRKRAGQRVAVQYATTRLLAESGSVAQASKRLLPELALNLEFDTAELWLMNYEEGTLRCADFWASESVPREYGLRVRELARPIGEGLPGRVFDSQEPLWINDLEDISDPARRELARLGKLRTAVAVPVLIWPDVAGVLLLASKQVIQADRELLQTLAAVGAQVGQFLTRRKALDKLQETTEVQRAILQSANFSIIATDANGVIQSMNAAAEQWLGYKNDDLVGKATPVLLHDWQELVQKAERLTTEIGTKIEPGLEALFYFARHGIADEGDYMYVRSDGTTFPVRLSLTALRGASGEVAGFVAIAQDITERRAVDRMKNEFVSVVSHELRTPLTSIRGSLGLLAAGLLGEVSEKGNLMLKIAISNTDRLVRLINDILDIERLESGKITLERHAVGVEMLVSQATDTMRGMAEKSGVKLEAHSDGGQVYGDPDRILQTLTNLLSNAIKFSNEKSTVVLTARTDGDHVLFSVADHGRGIPADKVSVIFERFQQVDASDSREKGGTGLGLAICRTIVMQHGGDIWVESTLGEGSTFYFTIPTPAAIETGAARAGGAHKKVLLCDDDAWLQTIVSKLLVERGYAPMVSSSVPEMLQKAGSERPDVILLDLVLPEISGWQGLEQLRADEKTRDIPVIILSGIAEKEARASQTGTIQGWVQKPFDADRISAALDDVFARAERREQATVGSRREPAEQEHR